MGIVVSFPTKSQPGDQDLERAFVACAKAEGLITDLAARLEAVIADLNDELDLIGELTITVETAAVFEEMERERAHLHASLIQLAGKVHAIGLAEGGR